MRLNTDRLILIEVSETDLEDIYQLQSLPETDQFNTLGIPESIDSTKNVLKNWLSESNTLPRISYTYTIKHVSTGNFIGLFGLKMGKAKYRIAEVWYQILPIYWNKGYTSEALRAVLNYGFNTLDLHRIEAGCATKNIASIKVLEKSGFIREGHARKILPIRGDWVDNYSYAILDEDFYNIYGNNED